MNLHERNAHMDLNHARLPIPPYLQMNIKLSQSLCKRNHARLPIPPYLHIALDFYTVELQHRGGASRLIHKLYYIKGCFECQ